MFANEDICWLNLTESREFCLQYFNKISRVIQNMTNFDSQYSFFTFFLSRRFRETVLRDLFFRNNIRRYHRNKFINLCLNFFIMNFDHSLLFIDNYSWFFISRRINKNMSRKKCIISIVWNLSSDLSMIHLIYARLIFLFNDVICIFVDDIEDLESIVTYLIVWMKIDNFSSFSIKIWSRVVIVKTKENMIATQSVLKFNDLQLNLQLKNN
jgi:hypothetical protein